MTTEFESTLVLDARARAMLAEMGVQVWLPGPKAALLATPVQSEASALVSPAAPASSPSPAAASNRARAAEQSLAKPKAEQGAAKGVMAPSPSPSARQPVRYVIAAASSAAPGAVVLVGEACHGRAAELLGHLLGLFQGKGYFAELVPAAAPAGEGDVSLAAQLAPLQAKVVVAMGLHSAQALLGEALQAMPFSKLRGQAHAVAGLAAPVFVTYHPQQLLRQPLSKAQAWLDLKPVRALCSL